jgi:hypothetical protein
MDRVPVKKLYWSYKITKCWKNNKMCIIIGFVFTILLVSIGITLGLMYGK